MSPFQLMRHFSEAMDRMWNTAGLGRERGEELPAWRPTVEIRENNGQLQVNADLPGVKESDVKVSVENDVLVIQGERKREQERDENGWHRTERSYGSFYRPFPCRKARNPKRPMPASITACWKLPCRLPKPSSKSARSPFLPRRRSPALKRPAARAAPK